MPTKVTAPAPVSAPAAPEAPKLAPIKTELMRLPHAFKLISQVLVNNDPTILSEQIVEGIRDIVAATGYASAYAAQPADEEG